MKKLIHEVEEPSGNNYQLWAELTECGRPEGYKALKFFSMYTGANNPEIPWNKGQFFLPPEALKNLKDLLEEK